MLKIRKVIPPLRVRQRLTKSIMLKSNEKYLFQTNVLAKSDDNWIINPGFRSAVAKNVIQPSSETGEYGNHRTIIQRQGN